jgi:hypothetical protein
VHPIYTNESAIYKYFGPLTNKSDVHSEVKRRMNTFGNLFLFEQKYMYFCPLSKTIL